MGSARHQLLTGLLLVGLGLSARSAPQDQVETAWENLAGADAEKAYRAVWAFVRNPQQGVSFLQDRLTPAKVPDPQVVAQLINDLDSNTFAVRNRAMQELERLAELAEPALRAADRAARTLEKKKRIERLLALLQQPPRSVRLRELRAVEVLEQVNTNAARRLLEQLGGGADGSRLTVQARESLARLARRPRPAAAAGPLPITDFHGDILPPGAVARLGTVRFRNTWAGCFTPDSKSLAGCRYGEIHLFDVATGKERPGFPLRAGDERWENVTISPDGRLMAAAVDGTQKLVVWELPSGKKLHELTMLKGNGRFSRGDVIWFSPDGKELCSADDRSICWWDLKTGKSFDWFRHSDDQDRADRTALSPDGKYLAMGNGEKWVPVWDVARTNRSHRLEGHERGIWSVAFSRDGKLLATGGYNDRTVRIWDMETGKQLRRMAVAAQHVRDLALSPDQKQLAAATLDLLGPREHRDAVCLWNLESAVTPPRVLPAPGICWVRYSPDGKRLALGSCYEAACLIDRESGKDVAPLPAHRGGVWSVACSPDGTQFATASEDHTVRLWDAATGKPLKTLAGHVNAVHAVAFSPDGAWVATGSDDGTAQLWDVATGVKKHTLKHDTAVCSVVFSPDGRFLATDGRIKNTTQLWDVAEGKQVRTFEGEEAVTAAPVFSPDGKFLAEGSRTLVSLRDLATGKVVRTFPVECDRGAVAFSPDGRTLAATSKDRVILWELLTGEQRASLPAKNSAWGCRLVFSPDGRLLGYSDRGTPRNADSQFLVWDLATRQERGPFRGHHGDVNALTFSPDSARVATASQDTTVLIWDVGIRKRP